MEEQEKSLKAEEIAVNNLKEEKENLGLLVETDREVVEAIFKQQEKRQVGTLWFERILGWFTGIITSLIVSMIWKWKEGRKAKKEMPEKNA